MQFNPREQFMRFEFRAPVLILRDAAEPFRKFNGKIPPESTVENRNPNDVPLLDFQLVPSLSIEIRINIIIENF